MKKGGGGVEGGEGGGGGEGGEEWEGEAEVGKRGERKKAS